mgnify:CR=1 FL=1
MLSCTCASIDVNVMETLIDMFGAVARIISNPAATDFVAVEPLWQPDARRGAATPIEEALGTNDTVDGGAQEPEAQ